MMLTTEKVGITDPDEAASAGCGLTNAKASKKASEIVIGVFTETSNFKRY